MQNLSVILAMYMFVCFGLYLLCMFEVFALKHLNQLNWNTCSMVQVVDVIPCHYICKILFCKLPFWIAIIKINGLIVEIINVYYVYTNVLIFYNWICTSNEIKNEKYKTSFYDNKSRTFLDRRKTSGDLLQSTFVRHCA